MKFHFNTSGRLIGIFAEHCNLCAEQFEELSRLFMDLVDAWEGGDPMTQIERQENELKIIINWLYNTKELTLKEQNDLENLIDEIRESEEKAICTKAITEGTIL